MSTQNPNNTGTHRRRWRKKYKKGGIAKNAYRLAKQANRKIDRGKELKFADENNGNAILTVDQNGTVKYCLPIATGNDYNARIGRKIYLVSSLIRLSVAPPAVPITATTPYNLRMILLQDREPDQVLPAAGEILQTVGNNNAPFSPIIALASMRWRVIVDRLYTVCQGDVVNDKIYVKYKKNRVVQFSGTTNAITSCGQGALYLLFISSDNPAATIVAYHHRVRFTDD